MVKDISFLFFASHRIIDSIFYIHLLLEINIYYKHVGFRICKYKWWQIWLTIRKPYLIQDPLSFIWYLKTCVKWYIKSMNDQKNTICIECKCRRYLSYKKQLAMELPPITCNKYRSLRQYRKKNYESSQSQIHIYLN